MFKRILTACVVLALCVGTTGCTSIDTADVKKAVDDVTASLRDINVSDIVISQEVSPEDFQGTATEKFLQHIGTAYSCRYSIYDSTDGVKNAVTQAESVVYSCTDMGRYVSTNPYITVDGEKAYSLLGKHFFLESNNTWYKCEGFLTTHNATQCDFPHEAALTEYLLNTVCTAENYRKNAVEANLSINIKCADAFLCDENVYVYIYDGYNNLSKIVNVTAGVAYAFDVWYAPEDVVGLQQKYLSTQ